MRLRTQLVIAFLLLAIVPLSVIVGASYLSSVRAVRRAVQEEGEAMTQEMDGRLVTIRHDLRQRLTSLSAFPFRSLAPGSNDDRPVDDRLLARLALSMGESAPLVESLEFIPDPKAAPAGPPPAAPPAPPAPGAEDVPDVQDVADVEDVPPPSAPEPFVIDMSQVVREVEQATGRVMEETDRRKMTAGLEAGMAVAEFFSQPDVLAGMMRGEVDEEALEARMNEIKARVEAASGESEDEGEPGAGPPPEPAPAPAEPPSGRLSNPVEVAPAAASAGPEGWSWSWLGDAADLPVVENGEVVGRFRARLSGEEILRRVLAQTSKSESEIAFAMDPDGKVYTSREEDGDRIREILADREAEGAGSAAVEDWMVVSSRDADTGLEFGIARPIRGSIEEMRRAAARNLGWGLSLTLVAMLAVLPLSRRLTSRLETVTRGAARIAHGDLTTRVPTSSPYEVGRLAQAFNHMAEELSRQRERLVREEAHRREQELREQRLELEFHRKKDELEEARRFQLSLLPESLPEVPGLDLAVHTETATEVGGDYYDFRPEGGTLTVAVGDATGHGARAGTMVTVVKGLFAAFPVIDDLAGFLGRASETIRGMGLERMRMAFTLARFEGETLRLASGGMPPVLIRRRGGAVEEVSLPGMPLGGLVYPYEERRVRLESGDVVLFMSDGLAELADLGGTPFGYERVKEILAATDATRPAEVLTELVEAGRSWAGEGPPPDDVTLLVVRRA